MLFIIKGLKYDTENMEKVASVRKWFRVDNILNGAIFPGQEVGHMFNCELWKSKKGNWLLTHEEDYTNVGQDITEDDAKELLLHSVPGVYETLYGEIEEA